MNHAAKTVLRTFIQNGDALTKVYRECKKDGGALDWDRFRTAIEQADLTDRVLGVDACALDRALAEVRQERQRLRDQWAGKEMPCEVLDQLSRLSDVGMMLVDEKLDVGLTPAYVTWMMDKAVPLLLRVAPLLLA